MSKYRPPTKGGELTPPQKRILAITKEKLARCRDLRSWCESLGFRLRYMDLEEPSGAFLHGETIYLSNVLTMDERVFAIGHEFAHREFHVPVTMYTLDKIVINKKEKQANAFAEELRKAYVG